VHTEPAKGVSDDYRKLNKLGKVPTFEGADGYILSECMAIAIYSKSSHTPRPRKIPAPSVSRAVTPGRVTYNSACSDEQSYNQLQLSLSEDYC